MKLTPTTALAALILIGAGGFMAGRISSSTASPSGSPEGTAESYAAHSTSHEVSRESNGTSKSTRTARTERGEKGSPHERMAKLEAIMRGENTLDRNRAFLAYLDQLGPGDFAAAAALFNKLELTDSRRGEYSLLFSAWAQADPTAALAFAKENGGHGINTVMTSWASVDPESAIRWAKANFSGEGANPYLPGIIRSLSTTDPARATELLASMPRSVERGNGLDYMLPHLLQQGADATRNWISSLSDDVLKNGAMSRSVNQLAATDPAGTAAWLIANPGEAQLHNVDDVYGIWANSDKQAAIASFTAMPPGENRTNALRGMVSTTATQDPKAAVALMNSYPNDVTDRVVQNFVWHSMESDPALAATQIARIADQEQRDQTYRRTLDNWLERDPTAATAWLQNNPMSPTVQKHLDARLNPRK